VRCRHSLEVLRRPEEATHGLLQVDDVNHVALAVYVRLHLRVPPARAMAEVDASIDQVFYHKRHENDLLNSNDQFRTEIPEGETPLGGPAKVFRTVTLTTGSVYSIPDRSVKPRSTTCASDDRSQQQLISLLDGENL